MTAVLRWGRSAYESDADLDAERAGAEALGLRWRHAPSASRPDALGEARILVVTSGVRVDDACLAAFAGDCVITTTSGYDHIDLDAARRRRVAVARCPMARRDPVVEVAVGALLSLRHRLGDLDDAARAGEWARSRLPGLSPRGVAGATIAVIGHGVIGARVCEVLDALGARVRAVDPAGTGSRPGWALHDALAGADGLTLHCALSSTSRELIGRAELELLARGAVVVNTARGDVLDVEAAMAGVLVGDLGGLCVDVFPVEPYPRLADFAGPRVLLTPHAAGYTVGLGARVASEVSRALAAWIDTGALPHRVV
jgi:phosphoglycerate dehydrogenase-like enzyme